MKTNTRPYIFVLTALTAIVSLTLFFIALSCGWFGEYKGAGSGFCECMRPGLIKQPANTWSNLGFVTAGLAMAWSLAKGTFDRNRNALTENVFNATFFSSLVVLLGPGSMAMHASGTRLGGFFDVLSMYLIDGFMVAYSAQRLFRFGTSVCADFRCAVLATCLFADKQRAGVFIFLGQCGVRRIHSRRHYGSVQYFRVQIRQTPAWGFASFGAITLAFLSGACRARSAVVCAGVVDSGHAIWHLLDAVSVYCLFDTTFRSYPTAEDTAHERKNTMMRRRESTLLKHGFPP
jgi:hypothetical protein